MPSTPSPGEAPVKSSPTSLSSSVTSRAYSSAVRSATVARRQWWTKSASSPGFRCRSTRRLATVSSSARGSRVDDSLLGAGHEQSDHRLGVSHVDSKQHEVPVYLNAGQMFVSLRDRGSMALPGGPDRDVTPRSADMPRRAQRPRVAPTPELAIVFSPSFTRSLRHDRVCGALQGGGADDRQELSSRRRHLGLDNDRAIQTLTGRHPPVGRWRGPDGCVGGHPLRALRTCRPLRCRRRRLSASSPPSSDAASTGWEIDSARA